MKANVLYNDFIGTASADISDSLGSPGGDDLTSIGRYFGLDEKRFEIVGLSIYGVSRTSISLLCVDKTKSTPEKEYIVYMHCDQIDQKDENPILKSLFKRFHIVLHNRHDDKYPELSYDE